jgi:hypothetical protein
VTRVERTYSGAIEAGDECRVAYDDEDNGAVWIGGVDVINNLDDVMPNALVVLKVADLEHAIFSGDGRTELGYGYSEWTPMDKDKWYIGDIDVLTELLNHVGKHAELCVSWERQA